MTLRQQSHKAAPRASQTWSARLSCATASGPTSSPVSRPWGCHGTAVHAQRVYNNMFLLLLSDAVTYSDLHSQESLPGVLRIHGELHGQAGGDAVGAETWAARRHFAGIICRKDLHLEGT